ncbi:MAG: phenylalanine--tRNA ligase subunit beta [Acetobacteraceae bacterium]|nr:phenylalanine--tRNA ligase subunit beta [Acetobacteraceae bacterium]
MRVSYRWLKEYVDPGWPVEELADRLTMAGLEVGEIERRGEQVKGVVVGELLSVEPHPQGGRLKVCRARVSPERTVTLVSGAPNLRAGERVAVALPGALLPGGRVIGAVDLRGVVSEGMPCSSRELGLPEDRPEEEAGVLVLPHDAPVGQEVSEYLELDDAVLVLDLTTNRGDCLSMLGVAREVAALAGAELRLPALAALDSGPARLPGRPPVTVDLEAPDLCPRYTGLLVEGVRVGASPGWLQRRLMAAGQRPINSVVDVTNYVMLELGQPLHAFDYDRLEGGRIVVRRARAGERLVTLDGVERALDPEMLVIADAEAPVALAGVMGGERSEIRPGSTVLLLESAHFAPASIRRTSRRLGLPSQASTRFERWVDPAGTVAALARVMYLLGGVPGGGQAVGGPVDAYPRPIEPRRIALRPARVNLLLGQRISRDEMVRWLRRLGLEVRRAAGRVGDQSDGGRSHLVVTVPTRRPDLVGEADLAEEIGRLRGFDRVPSRLLEGPLFPGRRPAQAPVFDRVREALSAAGLFEVLTYSLIDPRTWDRWALDPAHPWRRAIAVANPLRQDRSVLRTTLVPGLLGVLAYNASRGSASLAAYELGSVYLSQSIPPDSLPEERPMVAAAAAGEPAPRGWLGPRFPADFFFLKGAVEAVLGALGICGAVFEPCAHPLLEPGRAARIRVGSAELGYLGELSSRLVEEYRLPAPAAVFELDGRPLCELCRLVPAFQPLPRFPAVARDISLVVREGLASAEVESVIGRAAGELLEALVPFDVYRGEGVPAGCRSLAYSLTFRARDRTLTDAEVDEALDRVRKALVGELGAVLRS